MKNIKKILLLLFVLCSLLFAVLPVRADELEEVEKKLADLKRQLEMSQAATRPLETTLTRLGANLEDIKNRVGKLEDEIIKKEKEVSEGEKALEAFEEILGQKVRSYYIKTNYQEGGLLASFLGNQSFSQGTRIFAYYQAAINEDKKTIIQIVLYLKNLEEKKKSLENEKVRLAKVKAEIDSQAAFLKKEVEGAKAYQTQLTGEIAKLTSRQQALLAEKTGTFATSVGDVPLADDPASRPDYNPGFSPAFAAFSFGAPHRKGMSQYGAFGRAKSGQSAEDILRAYYGSGIEIKKDYSTSININVEGYGSIDIETYTKRIYEMPGSWGDEGGYEALKAQAVAARSYALARTNNGAGSICATESCQVYKPQNKGGNWDRAVDDTRGRVLMANGKPFSSWYASTSGGYNFSYSSEGYSTPGGWDTKCSNQSCWTGDAFEKIAGSPWFYKGWYKTRSGETCGRSHPWLSEAEFADILNALIVSKADGEAAKHIFPVDVNSCFGKSEDVWDMGRMKDEANKHGGAINSVNNISVSYSTGGQTASFRVQTNRGELSFSGDEFKTIFNLRAPGRIFLQSSLFNIEKK